MRKKIEIPLYGVHDFHLQADPGERDPFRLALGATFVHESGQRIENVPGFTEGDGQWVIRFSPTIKGRWEGVTASSLNALDGRELGPIECVENANKRVHGRLQRDPGRPRRFCFEDGIAFIPLGFECDWLFALHQTNPSAFAELVNLLASRGFNYIVTNIYAHTGFAEPLPGAIFAPPPRYVFGGSNDAPDHTRLNMEFFHDFDAMMAALHERGIVVHLMIQVQNKHVRWPARRSAEDDLYWRYIVSRYQAYGNIVWDIGKESYYLLRETGSHDYTLNRIELIRRTDAYDHLVTVHDSEGDSPARNSAADDACDFVSDQIHLGDITLYNHEALRRFRNDVKPYMNIEYGYEEGVESIETYRSETTRPWQDILLWTCAIYLGGGYPCYYYTNAAWDLIKWEPEPPGWMRYRYLIDFLKELDFNTMAPDNDFVDRGFCMAEPGKQYLIFLPKGGDVRVDLTAIERAGLVECEWMDIYTGQRASSTLEKWGLSTHLQNGLDDTSTPCMIRVSEG